MKTTSPTPPSPSFGPAGAAFPAKMVTLSARWLKRGLRGLGPGAVWLSADLQAHLQAPVPGTSVGGLLRVDVQDVSAAEALLAPILPDAAAWHAGMQAAP